MKKRRSAEELKVMERRLSGRRVRRRSSIRRGVFIILYYLSLIIHRVVELAAASFFMLTVSLPLLLLLLLRRIFTGQPLFREEIVYGERAVKRRLLYFNFQKYFLANAGLFFYVITGDLALVGVSIKRHGEKQRVLGDSYLYNNKPGIFNLWYIRESSRIGHEGQFCVEWEYMFRRNLAGDLALILKSIPAALYYQEAREFSDRVNLFELDFMNVSMKESITLLNDSIEQERQRKVYFVNPDCLNKIFRDEGYFHVLERGDYVFPDGIGINIACKIIRNPLKENVNGTDMLPFLCEAARDRGYSIYLLGARPGVAEAMKSRLESDWPGLSIAGARDGYFDREKESRGVIDAINESGAQILLVALGAPHQEKWIDRHAPDLNPFICMGVGGLFDFFSGNMPRAPRWMREMGLEWTYRLMQEPGRMWRRYIIGNPLFIYRVLRWKTQGGSGKRRRE